MQRRVKVLVQLETIMVGLAVVVPDILMKYAVTIGVHAILVYLVAQSTFENDNLFHWLTFFLRKN